MRTRESTPMPGISTLRAAIPARCFQPSLLTSILYVVRDIVAIMLLFYVATLLAKSQSPWVIPLWAVYSFIQGLFFTGIWILAHECGHDAFSTHKKTNSIIGYILHSLVLVPFFSWKYSHSRHHRYANHMDKDTVFVPERRESYRTTLSGGSFLSTVAEDAPIISLLLLLAHQLFGWPAYIFLNVAAGEKSLVKLDRSRTTLFKQSHLHPTAHLFTQSEHPYVLLSDIGLVAVLSLLILASNTLGLYTMLLIYGLPYLWMNHWLIAITYLHHTHPEAPHYEDGTWTFQKGALSTIDRDFGFIGRHIFHGIIEYHVVHHLFPRIPFYYAEEATLAIAPLLKSAYLREESSFLLNLWSTFMSCKYVEEKAEGKRGHMYWVR